MLVWMYVEETDGVIMLEAVVRGRNETSHLLHNGLGFFPSFRSAWSQVGCVPACLEGCFMLATANMSAAGMAYVSISPYQRKSQSPP